MLKQTWPIAMDMGQFLRGRYPLGKSVEVEGEKRKGNALQEK